MIEKMKYFSNQSIFWKKKHSKKQYRSEFKTNGSFVKYFQLFYEVFVQNIDREDA